MQALYSTEDMMALDPMTLQPVNLYSRKVMESPVKNTTAPISELGKKLLSKAQEGDTDQVRELMAKGAPFTTDWLGTSPLHWAAQNNHIETVEVLLRAGISRDARNKVERTPLHVAAQEGHLEILTLLIEFGADVDCKDMLRMTPLHWASENGHVECVRVLLNNGADPLCINKFDKTPDQIAFDNNRLDIVQMIQQIAAMDPMSRPTKQRKEIMDKATLQATMSISNSSPQKATEETRLTSDTTFNKVKTKTLPNALFTKPPVTEIRVMKMSTGKRKIINNEVMEEARGKNEMGTIPNPTDKTLQLLQAHGITMLPVDDSSIVASAMQSGQTVVLTEAGKLALNQTGKAVTQSQNTLTKPLMSSKVFPLSGKKVIKIRADQLINMTKERKVIIHTDKKFKLNPKRQLDEAFKAGEERRPTQVELEEVQKQLEEARKQVEMYKEQYLQKEKEAEHYKMQLEAFIIGK